MTKPQPCGTNAAYNRHLNNSELPCPACQQAHDNAPPRLSRHRTQAWVYNRTPTSQLIEDITFLLNAGEGTQRILQATAYTGRERTLRSRLTAAGRADLADRVITPWELAA